MLSSVRDDGRPVLHKEKQILRVLSAILPYVFLLVASLVPFASFFKTGADIPSGDDMIWHSLWSYDLYLGFQDGFFGLNSPSHHLMGNLGLGTYLFYGPLSHYFVAMLHAVFPFLSLNIAWKILAVGSTYLGGIWTYHLARRICKDDLCALMLGICFVFMPYRLNCFLYRAAYPEAVALSFFPLLFLGVQKIADQDFSPLAFTECVLGVSLLILSHPFTALIGVLCAVGYLLLSYRWIVPFFKTKKAWIQGLVSVALVFLLIGWYFFPMLEYKASGLYIVSDPIAMWTNVDHLAGDVGRSTMFSGLLRPDWIDKLIYDYGFANPGRETFAKWIGDYVAFGFFGGLSIVILEFLSKRKHTFQGAALGAFVSLLALPFSSREECFLVIPLYAALLLFIGYSEEDKRSTEETIRIAKEEVKRPEIYWAFLIFILCFVLMYSSSVWSIVPSIFLMAQFPWRFWGLCMFLAIVLLAYLVKPISNQRMVKSGLAFVTTIVFLSCMGPIDKRFATQTGHVRQEPTMEMIQNQKRMGSQNEYVPMVFQRNSGHKSEYKNSLYTVIYREINYSSHSYQFTMEEYHNPAFLEGKGDLNITSLNSPEATFEGIVESESAFIQFPQFYYDGYVLEWKRIDVPSPTYGSVKGEYVDGLVSFHLDQGSYELSLRWKGTTSYQVFSPLFIVGIVGVVALNAIPWAIEIIKKKKEATE